MIILIYLAVAVAAAYGLYRYFPNATRRWFYRIQSARKVGFAALVLVTMVVSLISGVWYLVLFGLFLAGLVALEVIFEDPLGVT